MSPRGHTGQRTSAVGRLRTAGGDDDEVRHVLRGWSGQGFLAGRNGRLGDFGEDEACPDYLIEIGRKRPVEIGAVRTWPLVFVQVFAYLHAAVFLPGHRAVLEARVLPTRRPGARRA